MKSATLRVMAGKYWSNMTLTQLAENKIKVEFPYNPTLIAEIKAMEGARWNPDGKYWTVTNSQRNRFQFEYLAGQKPYARYDAPLLEYTSQRKLYAHQTTAVKFMLTRRGCILAGEPGTGKTLAAIEVMEASGLTDWLWVGPRSALRAVELEFYTWESRIWPKLVTYDGLKKLISNWKPGTPAPHGIVFDESQKIKTPTAQRSLAAKYIASAARDEYGSPYVILMSGTPAPKSPVDWYFQTEVACPGFLREGTYEKFKRRMGLIVENVSITGVTYPELVTWWDDKNKCKICGKYADDPNHVFGMVDKYHPFEESVNEVEHLYKRLKGLVLVQFKKDCLDLPEKRYKIIRCKANESVLRAAKLIVARAPSALKASSLLRQLSDGFQYQEETVGTKTCPVCNGKGEIEHPVPIYTECPACNSSNIEGMRCLDCQVDFSPDEYESDNIPCPNCDGEKEVPVTERKAAMVECPKDDVVNDLLEEYEDVGRVVFYAGFTGSVDRCVSLIEKKGWKVIRADGRGWWNNFGVLKDVDMLRAFQDPQKRVEKLAFVGQPDAAGAGLTLTASPVNIFYSNSHKPDSRMQAVDRIHRAGMDMNRGATIVDIIHLPTDEKVLNTLNQSKKLQDMSLGELSEALDTYDVTRIM